MEKETCMEVDTTIHGLMYAASIIDKVLVRKECHLDAQTSKRHGPFAQTINRIAEIVDGAPIPDIEKTRGDLMFLLSLQRHLQGGFYSSMWDILARAHEILADLITEQEAKVMMGEDAYWLDLDARLGHIHPLEMQEDGAFRTYNATYLRTALGEIRYARYELEALKRTYENRKKITSE